MSIGKSSLARAAAAAGTVPAPVAERVPLSAGLQQVAVEAIAPAAGDKLPARVAQELVQSVKTYGVVEPLVLARTAPDTLLLVSGGRRLAAAKRAGLATVPALVVDQSAADAATLRKEMKAFATAPAAGKSGKTEPESAPAATAVGQAMPDWLL